MEEHPGEHKNVCVTRYGPPIILHTVATVS